MGGDDLLERAKDAKLSARMNCVYYEMELAKVQRWDRGLRFTSMFLATGGVAAAIKASESAWAPIGAGFISAFVSALSMVYTSPERAKAAAALLPQYVDVHNRLRDLVAQGMPVDEAALKAVLQDVAKLEVLEAKEIRTSNLRMLKKAQTQVERENGLIS